MWNGAWPTLEIVNLGQKLDTLRELVKDSGALDVPEDVSAELGRFLVVRTCGYLEQVTELACLAYLKSKSDPRSHAFGASWLGRGTNPSPSNLITLVGRFESAWARELEGLLKADDELLHREISFLVDRRNKIAHGLSEGVGVSKAIGLIDPTKQVTKWFLRRLDPTQ